MTRALDRALATLGLRPDADARAVRRAYAQQLKQIDQATQLQAFQELREAYERALGLIARREAEARELQQDAEEAETQRHEPAAREAEAHEHEQEREALVPPSAAAEPAPPGPDTLARAVFATLATRAAEGFTEEPQARDALQQALADDRLLNLEARMTFEWQVAQLLMGGWQPGHEFLFGPACEVFDWERDRAHLRIFGPLGAALDAAINEKLIFFAQPAKQFDLLRNVIRRLRQPAMPSVAMRRADLRWVQLLVQRYPHWLRLIAPQAHINSWFADLQEAPAASASTEPLIEPEAALQRGWKPAKSLPPWLFAAFLLMMAVKFLMPSEPPRFQPPPAGAPRFSMSTPSGPPITTWPPAGTTAAPGNDSFGIGATPQRPLYDLPPPNLLTGARYDAQPGGRSTRERAAPAATAAQAPLPQGAEVDAAPTAITTVLPPPRMQARPPPEEAVRIGHVTVVHRDGQVVVDEVGERTAQSFGTLQAGDRLLGCVSGDYHLPLALPADARRCVATVNTKTEPGVTPYMFRVLRYGQSVPASLTLRDTMGASAGTAASAPAAPLTFSAPPG